MKQIIMDDPVSPNVILGYNHLLLEKGIINDYIINNIIIYVMSCNERIKDVSLFVDKDAKSIGVLVYLNRWDLYFKSNKIYENLIEALKTYLYGFNVDINFKIYKKNDKRKQNKA